MKEIASHWSNLIDVLNFSRPEHAHRRIMKNQLSCGLTCCCFSSCDSEEDKNASLLRLRDLQGSRRVCVISLLDDKGRVSDLNNDHEEKSERKTPIHSVIPVRCVNEKENGRRQGEKYQ